MMTTILIIFAACLCGLLFAAKARLRGSRYVTAANAVAAGTHAEGNVPRLLESAAASRYLLAIQGTAATEVDIAGADAVPLGIITDEGSAGDTVNVQMLGAGAGTMLVLAGGDVSPGDSLSCGANGKAVDASAQAAGDHPVFGIALTAGADGELVEFAPRDLAAVTTT
jgi:hypothetical protein